MDGHDRKNRRTDEQMDGRRDRQGDSYILPPKLCLQGIYPHLFEASYLSLLKTLTFRKKLMYLIHKQDWQLIQVYNLIKSLFKALFHFVLLSKTI